MRSINYLHCPHHRQVNKTTNINLSTAVRVNFPGHFFFLFLQGRRNPNTQKIGRHGSRDCSYVYPDKKINGARGRNASIPIFLWVKGTRWRGSLSTILLIVWNGMRPINSTGHDEAFVWLGMKFKSILRNRVLMCLSTNKVGFGGVNILIVIVSCEFIFVRENIEPWQKWMGWRWEGAKTLTI